LKLKKRLKTTRTLPPRVFYLSVSLSVSLQLLIRGRYLDHRTAGNAYPEEIGRINVPGGRGQTSRYFRAKLGMPESPPARI
jgi:hypothetical protein